MRRNLRRRHGCPPQSGLYRSLFLPRRRNHQLLDDCAISLEELREILRPWKETKFLVGDGAQLCYNTLGSDMDGFVLLPEQLRQQRAAGAALLAWDMAKAGQSPSGAELIPNYLRLSQAERERQKKLELERG